MTNTSFRKAIAAASLVATIVASCTLCSCKGRKMSNMEPLHDTVEVVIASPDSIN